MLSDQGVWTVSRIALVVVLILITAALRTLVGPSKQRGRVMLAGTLGGLTVGVLSAPSLSDAIGVDVSGIASVIGVVLGWAVAWQFARRLPRTAA